MIFNPRSQVFCKFTQNPEPYFAGLEEIALKHYWGHMDTIVTMSLIFLRFPLVTPEKSPFQGLALPCPLSLLTGYESCCTKGPMTPEPFRTVQLISWSPSFSLFSPLTLLACQVTPPTLPPLLDPLQSHFNELSHPCFLPSKKPWGKE